LGFTGGGTSGAAVNVPIGACIPFGGAGSPSGYLLCDGQAINRITFGNLFAIIGTKYGVGDGSTTFNVPDMRTNNSFARGATDDAGRGTEGGLSDVTLAITELPAHNHPITPDPHDHTAVLKVPPGGASGPSGVGAVSVNTGPTSLTSTMTGGDTAHENKPPFVDFNWIIKA